ncbi:MAG TPA: hypothetical protein VM099_15140 [Gemmatimonadaceae bacterium]|nr:hypothetical protein [Gemmatimonadaceae bacterium]
MKRQVSLAIAILWVASGCRLLDFDSCMYELRTVTVEGRLIETSEILYAYVSVEEQRDYQPDKFMVWRLTSAPLRGHVTSMTLRDAADESKSLFVFPASNFQNDISSGTVRQSDGPSLNGIFDAISSERAVIDVRTDIPGRAQVRFLPPLTVHQEWYRPKCG